jgi:hypothetical protein
LSWRARQLRRQIDLPHPTLETESLEQGRQRCRQAIVLHDHIAQAAVVDELPLAHDPLAQRVYDDGLLRDLVDQDGLRYGDVTQRDE